MHDTPQGFTTREMLGQLNGLEYVAFMIWRDPKTNQTYHLRHLPHERYAFEPVNATAR